MLSSLQSPCNPKHWVLRCSQLWVDLGVKLIPKDRRASPTSTRNCCSVQPWVSQYTIYIFINRARQRWRHAKEAGMCFICHIAITLTQSHTLFFQALPLGMRSVWLFCSCRRITGWRFWSAGGGRAVSAPKKRTTELKVCSLLNSVCV